MLAVIVDHRLADRRVGCTLVLSDDRGVDIEPGRVGLVLEHVVGQLPRHLGGPFRAQRQ